MEDFFSFFFLVIFLFTLVYIVLFQVGAEVLGEEVPETGQCPCPFHRTINWKRPLR